VSVINFYIDDSGTRYPNRKPGKKAEHGYDWFALGGVLVKATDETKARDLHHTFCERWELDYPLHSSEIRSRNKRFDWLGRLGKADLDEFHESLYQVMKEAPTVGLACVIDRPGYNKRYAEMYAKERWLLCKTAFSVVVERATKYARTNECRLRVAPERCNKAEDGFLSSYYESLKADGMPFAEKNSDKYHPLSAEEFRETLYEFKPKQKSSPMSQFADLYLWPVCMGGYHASNKPYARLLKDGKLIECHLPEVDLPTLATKYSCFDLVKRKP
jgi:hypothetical protein